MLDVFVAIPFFGSFIPPPRNFIAHFFHLPDGPLDSFCLAANLLPPRINLKLNPETGQILIARENADSLKLAYQESRREHPEVDPNSRYSEHFQ